METYVVFALYGLGLAAVYIGLGSALLLVHHATGIVNFAQGAMAMWGVYVMARVRNEGEIVLPVGSIDLGQEQSLPVAIAIGVVMAAAVGLLVYLLAFRPVRQAPPLAQVVVAVGVMIAMQALVVLRFGSSSVRLGDVIPVGELTIGGWVLPTRELLMALVMTVIVGLLWLYLRVARLGIAMRAGLESERGAVLMGYSPSMLAGIAMVVGTIISTVAVMLGASLTELQPGYYTLMVVPAMAVLLAARLLSLPVVIVASILLGAFQSVLTLAGTKPWWPSWAQAGLDQVVPFAVIMVVLLFMGKGLPARGSLSDQRLPDVEVPRFRLRTLILSVGLTVVVLALSSGVWRFGITFSLIFMVMSLSYVLVTGYLGQISLAQVAFAGTAGFLLSKLTMSAGLPVPIAVLGSLAGATLLGVVVAMPALRIRGTQLAIVTLAAALAIERFVFDNYSFISLEGSPVPAPSLFGWHLGPRSGTTISTMEFSLLVLTAVTIATLVFIRIASGVTGRAFLAVRANERAAASAGINVRWVKTLGFGISALYAGLAGCMIAFAAGQMSSASFSVMIGLQVLAAAYLGGISSASGAAVAGLLAPLGVVFVVLHQAFDLGDYYGLVVGIALVIGAIMNPMGFAGEFNHLKNTLQARWRRRHTGESAKVDQEALAHV